MKEINRMSMYTYCVLTVDQQQSSALHYVALAPMLTNGYNIDVNDCYFPP